MKYPLNTYYKIRPKNFFKLKWWLLWIIYCVSRIRFFVKRTLQCRRNKNELIYDYVVVCIVVVLFLHLPMVVLLFWLEKEKVENERVRSALFYCSLWIVSFLLGFREQCNFIRKVFDFMYQIIKLHVNSYHFSLEWIKVSITKNI